MTNNLRDMMAEIESWESAVEFGIPQDLLDKYTVRQRSDDLYISVLSSIFDNLRTNDSDIRKQDLADLAKTLLIYSRSAASKYLHGVEKTINLLYCAATFYLAGFPATATLIAKNINFSLLFKEEEFLYGLLSRKLNNYNEMERNLLDWFHSLDDNSFIQILSHFKNREKEGLVDNPRQFIASKLTVNCLNRFKIFNIWNNLKDNAANYSYGAWQPFLTNVKDFPLWELFPSQLAVIQRGILNDTNEVYSLQMPTSAGKTALCEILLYHEVKIRNKKVLFLVPFRALASEIKESISKRLENVGIIVVASHGGNIPTRPQNGSADSADVLIITPEKFVALAQNTPSLEGNFDTVICDEGHIIDDTNRGLQYELLLTKLKNSKDKARKIVFISAILPNVSEIHNWLGGSPEKLSESNYKPVENDFAFITKQDSGSWSLDFNTIYQRPRSYLLANFLNKDDFRYINPTTNRLNYICPRTSYITLACAAALKARRNGSVAVFTTQKGRNGIKGLAKKMLELCARQVALTLNGPPLTSALSSIVEYIYFQFGDGYSLSQLLINGIGFHHGDLPQEIRREMETAIQNGVINILICTSTLAEGVNLPIRTLVIHTIKRFDGKTLHPIENRSIKNIIGRVGRAGKETRGRIIFANDKERSEVENVFRDMHMEPAHGALFRLIESINTSVNEHNIQLSNDVFNAQDNDFLSTLDSIDIALINLIEPELIPEQIDLYIESLLENTLAYKYCNDTLKNRIREVFILRAQNLQSVVPRVHWNLLKKSGASPRFWNKVTSLKLIYRPEWQTLNSADDAAWIEEVIFEASLFEIKHEREVLKNVLIGWVNGFSYIEISKYCGIEIDETLEILAHKIGYQIQDTAAKILQLAIAYLGEESLSQIAINWPTMLQYGLNDLQQLDMFEWGASDRLGVWGISRYLKRNDIILRGNKLIAFLRDRSDDVKMALYSDERVPKLSAIRTFEELKLF